jgi:hypothetical protein
MCVVNEPVVQDQISGRGQKIVFLVSAVILRLVKSVVGIDRQRNSEAFAASGLNAIFIAFADNAFIGEAGVGEAIRYLPVMKMKLWCARVSLSPQIPLSEDTRKISLYSILAAVDPKRVWLK